MGDVVTDATVKALQEVNNIKQKFVQLVTDLNFYEKYIILHWKLLKMYFFFWYCHLQSNVICILISLILVRWKRVKMRLPPPPDLHLGNPRLGPPLQNQVYTYQINTLLYKHIMTRFWLVFIKIVQLESHKIIGYHERSFLAVLFFFYTEKQLPGNTWPIKIFYLYCER